jgi:hypothetical protein
MIKKTLYVVTPTSSSGVKMYFENLDGAMEMFKYLMQGKCVNIQSKSIKQDTDNYTPDKNDYVYSDYLHYIDKQEIDYHLESETIDIYTEEELEKLAKERDKKADEYIKKLKEKNNNENINL